MLSISPEANTYQPDSQSAYKLAAVDQRKDLALGIFEEIRGRQEIRAIGRYYLEEDAKRAEVAFVVHEKTRHLGMAGFLLGELAEIAKRRRISQFWANVLPDNRAMAGLFLAAGGKETESSPDDERSFEVPVEKILRTRKGFLERKRIQRLDR